jgi:hypothetical protein
MSDSRFHLKVKFEVYGKKFTSDSSLNWNAEPGECDERISSWFANIYEQAYIEFREAQYNTTNKGDEMSLDVILTATRPTEVFWANITHNLNKMAEEAGLYNYLWRPEELGIHNASELIVPLTEGLDRLLRDKDYFITLNPSNGWGDYENLVEFVTKYLAACVNNPDADISVSR